jgi:CheY-like chemotaxis protein
LIIDDNATNRRILEEVLRHWGLSFVAVSSGAAGLEELKSAAAVGRPFGLVLLDDLMPEMDGLRFAELARGCPDVPPRVTLLLSSSAREVARHGDLGIARWLPKPVRQSDLLSAILEQFSAAGPRQESQPTAPTPPVHPRRVLLAEDGLVNQKVATSLLQRRGHEVVIAQNGREAVDAVSREAFDVVLMDMLMPEMDGLEATAAIREMERHTGRHVPIIAMTANAMKDDRERCLEVGMDGFLTKPVKPRELYEAVESSPRPARVEH